MTNNTIEIQSSHGTLTVDQSGKVLSSDLGDDSGLSDIVKFDLFESNFFWNSSNGNYENQTEYDVCDLGDTSSDGSTHKAESSFRSMILLDGMRFTISTYLSESKETIHIKNEDDTVMFFDDFHDAEEYLDKSSLTNYSLQVNRDNIIQN
jgi:hypothetical protein